MQIMNLLDRLYRKFDDLTAKYGLFKVNHSNFSWFNSRSKSYRRWQAFAMSAEAPNVREIMMAGWSFSRLERPVTQSCARAV